MHVQEVSGCKYFTAIFALVGESARKVDVLNMLPKIAPITGSFSTECESVQARAIFDNVIIELLVCSCKHQSIRKRGNVYFALQSLEM